MTRRDFTTLAKALDAARPGLMSADATIRALAYCNLVNDVASICERHNSRFDRAKFREAAYAGETG